MAFPKDELGFGNGNGPRLCHFAGIKQRISVNTVFKLHIRCYKVGLIIFLISVEGFPCPVWAEGYENGPVQQPVPALYVNDSPSLTLRKIQVHSLRPKGIPEKAQPVCTTSPLFSNFLHQCALYLAYV